MKSIDWSTNITYFSRRDVLDELQALCAKRAPLTRKRKKLQKIKAERGYDYLSPVRRADACARLGKELISLIAEIDDEGVSVERCFEFGSLAIRRGE